MDNKELNQNLANENNTNNMPLKGATQSPVDFSTIFNVASEEQPENNTVSHQVEQQPQQKIEQPAEQVSNIKHSKPKEVFNGEEKMLYEIKPEKESSPIVPALFFIVLISTVLALPYISQKISFDNNIQTSNTTGGTETQEDEFYYFNKSSVRATIGELELTNFVKSTIDGEYRVSFNINNTSSKTYRFDKNYYVVFYNDRDEIVYYGLIHSYEGLGTKSAKSLTIKMSQKGYNDSVKFKIKEISTGSYPNVSLTLTEGDYDIMVCTYGFDSIKYYFADNELVQIYEIYKENSQDSLSYNFDLNKSSYKLLSNKYKSVANFSSIFVETEEEFSMINEFNLKEIPDATLSGLQTYKFFKYKESKNVVAFEMKAQGYLCS